MVAILKHNFRLQNARDFIEHFIASLNTASPRNHYMFVGKPTKWGDTAEAEFNAPTPGDSLIDDRLIWQEMLALKKIDDSRVSLVVRRSDWDISGNTIYAQYDDNDPNLYDQPTVARSNSVPSGKKAGNFYVINDEFDIFICVSNANNSASTVKPIRPQPSSLTNLINSIDGYIWKYLGTIKQSDILKYVTDSWIPVKKLTQDDSSAQWTVQQGAISDRGKVISVIMDTVGSGYVNTYSGTIASADNNGAGSVGQAVFPSSASDVAGIYAGAHLHITTTSGAEAGNIYEIAQYNGTTRTATLTTPWSTSPSGLTGVTVQILPKLDVVSDGTVKPRFRPVVTNNQITSVLTLNRGENVTFTKLSFSTAGSLGGGGAQARAVLSDISSGLGEDIEKDLGAHYVMLNARLEYREGTNNAGLADFPINNEYRQIGIIRDVRNFGTTTLSSETTLIATKRLLVQGVSGTLSTFDTVLTSGSGSSAKRIIVIDYIPNVVGGVIQTTGTISYIQNESTGFSSISAGDVFSGGNSFSATVSTNGIINEEVNKGFGEILYVENRRPVLRAQDQIEDIKAIIEF